MTRASGFLPPLAPLAVLAPWIKSTALVAALHLGVLGGVTAHVLMHPPSEDELGAESVIEFATLVARATSDFAPDAANHEAEDRQATPKLDETLSKKREDDLPTEQASPAEPVDPDLRMAQERTQKESETAPEMQQSTEAMAQQEQSVSSQASVAADTAPEQTGTVETAQAPDEGNALDAKRRIEAWQRQIFAHIVKFKLYPEAARARRLTGETQLAFSLARDGSVSNLRVTRSSGSSLLDQAAVAVLERANPLPKLPAAIKGSAVDLALPMRFTLK